MFSSHTFVALFQHETRTTRDMGTIRHMLIVGSFCLLPAFCELNDDVVQFRATAECWRIIM